MSMIYHKAQSNHFNFKNDFNMRRIHKKLLQISSSIMVYRQIKFLVLVLYQLRVGGPLMMSTSLTLLTVNFALKLQHLKLKLQA